MKVESESARKTSTLLGPQDYSRFHANIAEEAVQTGEEVQAPD